MPNPSAPSAETKRWNIRFQTFLRRIRVVRSWSVKTSRASLQLDTPCVANRTTPKEPTRRGMRPSTNRAACFAWGRWPAKNTKWHQWSRISMTRKSHVYKIIHTFFGGHMYITMFVLLSPPTCRCFISRVFLLACSFATTSHLRYASRNLRTVNIPTSRACGKLPNHHYNANWPRSKIRYGWFDERPRYERCLCLKKLDVTGRNTSVFCFSRRVNTKSLKIVQHGQVAYLFACRAVLSTFRVNLLYSSWGTAEH